MARTPFYSQVQSSRQRLVDTDLRLGQFCGLDLNEHGETVLKMRNRAAVLMVALFAVTSGNQGCLYLANGKTQEVRFESSPPGAQVVVNGIQ